MKLTRKPVTEKKEVSTMTEKKEVSTMSEKKEVSTMSEKNVEMHAIPFIKVARQNERCLVWDIRNVLCNSSCDTIKLCSLLKAWIEMQEHVVPQDAFVLRFAHEFLKVAYIGKDATCKPSANRDARLEPVSQGRIKAWLYTILREKAVLRVADSKPSERPEEKAVKARKARTIKVSEDEFNAYKKWLAMQEKKAE